MTIVARPEIERNGSKGGAAKSEEGEGDWTEFQLMFGSAWERKEWTCCGTCYRISMNRRKCRRRGAIFKEKGYVQECGNYRGIKLMSHTMKVWDNVIDRRLREETTMGEEQFGFMPRKGTTIAIFAARQMIEKHRVRQKALHMVFIDLDKAYDRVPRQVWRCMREKEVPEKYVRIVRHIYVEAITKAKSSVGLTSTITVRVGLHQGSSLNPYLFDLVMDVLGRGIK